MDDQKTLKVATTDGHDAHVHISVLESDLCEPNNAIAVDSNETS